MKYVKENAKNAEYEHMVDDANRNDNKSISARKQFNHKPYAVITKRGKKDAISKESEEKET